MVADSVPAQWILNFTLHFYTYAAYTPFTSRMRANECAQPGGNTPAGQPPPYGCDDHTISS
jgi:hypothetical protein